jgi:hypothetical protein
VTAPWWTAADQAELEALIAALVDDVFDHRAGCDVCAAGYPPCPYVKTAVGKVVAWRDTRMLRSRAVWARMEAS